MISDYEYVQALYTFTGKNNDELCFKKGDVIIVTQKEDGGWWEGTLNNNTGWFPSNYVTPCDDPANGFSPNGLESPPTSPQQNQQQVAYRAMVFKELIESERAYGRDLQTAWGNYLLPLRESDTLSLSDYDKLTGYGNFEEAMLSHQTLLAALEEQMELSSKEQKVGGTFLRLAPNISATHKAYTANHPLAAHILETHKEELNSFMERHGAAHPGMLTLTTLLSLPFRRLEKYPNMLLELHRHMEESHPDRGDTQRSIHVFKELALSCGAIRRQKQLELEVMTHKIYGLKSDETLSSFGDIILMKSVALMPDLRDRYLVLFPNCLVVLALSARASSFVFEGNYALNTLTVKSLEDGNQIKNAFEIATGTNETLVALCQSVADRQQWVESLQRYVRPTKTEESPKRASNSSSTKQPRPWTLSCLRPTPPLRPSFPSPEDKKSNKNKKKEEAWNEDDTLVLRVIEQYCQSAKARYTVNSSVPLNLSAPSAESQAVHEEADPTALVDKNCFTTVIRGLKDEMSALTQNYHTLRTDLDKEKLLTQSLKGVIEQYLGGFQNKHVV